VVLVHAMKTYVGVEVWLHSFLTSAPNSVSGQSSAPADLLAKEITQFQLNGGLSGRPRAGLGGVKT
jgi:hypothetical protein